MIFYYIKLNETQLAYNHVFMKRFSFIMRYKMEFNSLLSEEKFTFQGLEFQKIKSFWKISSEIDANESLWIDEANFNYFIDAIINTFNYCILYDGHKLSFIDNPGARLIDDLLNYQDKDIMLVAKYRLDEDNIVNSFLYNNSELPKLYSLLESFSMLDFDFEKIVKLFNNDQIKYRYEINYDGFEILPCNKIGMYAVGGIGFYVLHQKAFLSLLEQYKKQVKSLNCKSYDFKKITIVILGNYAKLTCHSCEDDCDRILFDTILG